MCCSINNYKEYHEHRMYSSITSTSQRCSTEGLLYFNIKLKRYQLKSLLDSFSNDLCESFHETSPNFYPTEAGKFAFPSSRYGDYSHSSLSEATK